MKKLLFSTVSSLLLSSTIYAHEDLNQHVHHEDTGKYSSVSCLVKSVEDHRPIFHESSENLIYKNGEKVWMYSYLSDWNQEKHITVKHSWYRNDQFVGKVVRNVNYGKLHNSYQTVRDWKTGKWRVVTRDIDGNPLNTVEFDLIKDSGGFRVVLADSKYINCDKAKLESSFDHAIKDDKQKSFWNFELAPSYYYQSYLFEYYSIKLSWLSNEYNFTDHFSVYARAGLIPLERSGGDFFIGYSLDLIGSYDFHKFTIDPHIGFEGWDEGLRLKFGVAGLVDNPIESTKKYLEKIGIEYTNINSDITSTNVLSILMRKSF